MLINGQWSDGRRSVVRSLIRISAWRRRLSAGKEETRRARRVDGLSCRLTRRRKQTRSGVGTGILPPHYCTKPSACRHDSFYEIPHALSCDRHRRGCSKRITLYERTEKMLLTSGVACMYLKGGCRIGTFCPERWR